MIVKEDPMSKFLIIYATKAGQTAKVSFFICEELKALGHKTEAFALKEIPKSLKLNDFDAVIIGAPVHAQRFPKALWNFVKMNSQILSQKPSAFFSVCLGILEKNPKVKEQEIKIVKDFFRSTGWNPEKWQIFAGALAYSKYNWFIKMIMKFISRRAGGDTDISKDYEY